MHAGQSLLSNKLFKRVITSYQKRATKSAENGQIQISSSCSLDRQSDGNLTFINADGLKWVVKQ